MKGIGGTDKWKQKKTKKETKRGCTAERNSLFLVLQGMCGICKGEDVKDESNLFFLRKHVIIDEVMA